jgi:hypothetical protein
MKNVLLSDCVKVKNVLQDCSVSMNKFFYKPVRVNLQGQFNEGDSPWLRKQRRKQQQKK